MRLSTIFEAADHDSALGTRPRLIPRNRRYSPRGVPHASEEPESVVRPHRRVLPQRRPHGRSQRGSAAIGRISALAESVHDSVRYSCDYIHHVTVSTTVNLTSTSRSVRSERELRPRLPKRTTHDAVSREWAVRPERELWTRSPPAQRILRPQCPANGHAERALFTSRAGAVVAGRSDFQLARERIYQASFILGSFEHSAFLFYLVHYISEYVIRIILYTDLRQTRE